MIAQWKERVLYLSFPSYYSIHKHYMITYIFSSIGVQFKSGDTSLLRFQLSPPGAASPICKRKGNTITISID